MKPEPRSTGCVGRGEHPGLVPVRGRSEERTAVRGGEHVPAADVP